LVLQEAVPATETKEEAIEKAEALEAERDASVWKPLRWRRAQMIAGFVFCALVMTVLIEFSFSDLFQTNQYAWLAIIKLLGLGFELYLLSVRSHSQLLCSHSPFIASPLAW
jgi:hypothetical protein